MFHHPLPMPFVEMNPWEESKFRKNPPQLLWREFLPIKRIFGIIHECVFHNQLFEGMLLTCENSKKCFDVVKMELKVVEHFQAVQAQEPRASIFGHNWNGVPLFETHFSNLRLVLAEPLAPHSVRWIDEGEASWNWGQIFLHRFPWKEFCSQLFRLLLVKEEPPDIERALVQANHPVGPVFFFAELTILVVIFIETVNFFKNVLQNVERQLVEVTLELYPPFISPDLIRIPTGIFASENVCQALEENIFGETLQTWRDAAGGWQMIAVVISGDGEQPSINWHF